MQKIVLKITYSVLEDKNCWGEKVMQGEDMLFVCTVILQLLGKEKEHLSIELKEVKMPTLIQSGPTM